MEAFPMIISTEVEVLDELSISDGSEISSITFSFTISGLDAGTKALRFDGLGNSAPEFLSCKVQL